MNVLPLLETLAFVPLRDPLTAIWPDLDRYWLFLLIPLVIAVCLVYKGTRIRHTKDLPRAAGVMMIQVFIVMIVAAAAVYGVYAVLSRAL